MGTNTKDDVSGISTAEKLHLFAVDLSHQASLSLDLQTRLIELACKQLLADEGVLVKRHV